MLYPIICPALFSFNAKTTIGGCGLIKSYTRLRIIKWVFKVSWIAIAWRMNNCPFLFKKKGAQRKSWLTKNLLKSDYAHWRTELSRFIYYIFKLLNRDRTAVLLIARSTRIFKRRFFECQKHHPAPKRVISFSDWLLQKRRKRTF